MKNVRIYMVFAALVALIFTSCSKEDSGSDLPGDEMGAVSFKALLKDFNRAQLTKQQVPGTGNYGLPECPDDVAGEVFVRVQLLVGAEGNTIFEKDGQSHFDVPVIPQDDGTWITDEGANDELELPQGVYRLNYFGVYAGETLIYLTPRENDDYGPAEYDNFVSDALPSNPFAVMNGQKKYVDVEVLCYDEHFVQQYGYLFFDFEEVEILYLCLFGNVCDEDGRHMPAVFRFDVWNYSGDGADPKGSKLFTAQNELQEGLDLLEQPYTYAEPVCVQLPDRAGETDMYYGEVWLLHDDGSEELIRFGEFDENDVWDLDYSVDGSGDSSSNYYHFREGCGRDDDSTPCLFSAPTSYDNDFDGDDERSFINVTGIDGAFTDVTTNSTNNSPGTATMWPEGTYGFFQSPSQVHPHWIDLSGDGNGYKLIVNGTEDDDDSPYFVITETEVCPDADYFVTFNLINVLGPSGSGQNNNVTLQPVVNGTPLNVTITAPYNGGNQTWMKIGLRLKADANGAFDVRFVNREDAAAGNDFAIDNVVISNDPTIMTGLDQTIVQ